MLDGVLNVLTGQPSDEALLEWCDDNNWVLICAHDALSGRMAGIGFDTWWSISRNNWMEDARTQFPRLTAARYKLFLRRFAEQARELSDIELYEQIAQRRGWRGPFVGIGGAITPPHPFNARHSECEVCKPGSDRLNHPRLDQKDT